jgi:hypothetical protein
MMIFLGDGYVNLDHVKKLQFTSDGTVANVHFTDGSSETLERFPLDMGHNVYPACRK